MRTARLPAALLATCFAAGLTAPCAQAAEVWFTGGFTSFRGPVATAAGDLAQAVHTEVNGTPVYADHALPGAQFGFARYGIGLKDTYSLRDAGGEPIPTVEFSRFIFGQPAVSNPNRVQWAASGPLDLQVGASFSIGTFTLTNGNWFGNSAEENIFPDTDLGFTVTTHSTDPLLNGHTFSGTLRLVVTSVPPTGTVQDDADYFYFVERPDLGTLHVYESVDPQGGPLALGNSGSVDLRVRIGSLIPVELSNATGGVFIGAPVPEPASVALWLGGLGLLAFGRGRRS